MKAKRAKPKPKPTCKCGKTCAYYGPIGGYSVKCTNCNARAAAGQRRRRRDRVYRKYLEYLAAKSKPKPPRITAQELCDSQRARDPHLLCFVGDPPCPGCRAIVAGIK